MAGVKPVADDGLKIGETITYNAGFKTWSKTTGKAANNDATTSKMETDFTYTIMASAITLAVNAAAASAITVLSF